MFSTINILNYIHLAQYFQPELSFFSTTQMRCLLSRCVYESAHENIICVRHKHMHTSVRVEQMPLKCLHACSLIQICIFYYDYGHYDYQLNRINLICIEVLRLYENLSLITILPESQYNRIGQ